MKTLTIMCGIPRCGKSTFVEKNKTNQIVISADDLRKLVYGKDFWSQGEPLVWSIRGIMLRDLMQQEIDIIIDETNTLKQHRDPIMKLAKQYGYKVKCIAFKPDVAICEGRALLNFQISMLPIIQKMANQFEPPVIAEGFAEIKWINTKEE